VGAQAAGGWCSPDSAEYLQCGPHHGTPKADENLIRLLEVTARINNTWVQVIPTFTYKHRNEGSQAKNIKFFNKMFDHVDDIVKAGNYKHVIYELFNEVVHPISQHIKDEDVREMFHHANARTHLPVGTDFHGEFRGEDQWPGRYPFIWRDVAGYLAFHTPRNPEPTYREMRDAKDRWNYAKPVLVDETVSWASDEEVAKYNLKGKGTIAMLGYGTEDDRMHQVVKHLRDIHRLGWRPFYHSIWGIHCLNVGRIPNYDRDIKQ
jgi:hypothetical protein